MRTYNRLVIIADVPTRHLFHEDGDRPMLRKPEPELMDDPEQARIYAKADFSEATRIFLALFEQKFPQHVPHQVVDLGCGPGEITLAFAAAHPQALVSGIDGSSAMLDLANQRLKQRPEFDGRVAFQRIQLPALTRYRYDTIVSNSLLHHLHDPQVLWQQIRQWGTPGTVVQVMDLYRPTSEKLAKQIVKQYAANTPEVLQRDFFNSLCAAFTLEEIQQQLKAAGLSHFKNAIVSDRHLAVWGILK